MSFWHNLGVALGISDPTQDEKQKAANAMNQAQVQMLNPETEQGNAFYGSHMHDNALSNSAAVQYASNKVNQGLGGVLAAASYIPVQADRGISAASLHNQGLDWQQAWNATGGKGAVVNGQKLTNVNIGSLAYNTIRHDTFGLGSDHTKDITYGGNAAQYVADQNTWTGKIASGAIDAAATWYADPLLLAGKVSKAARAGNSFGKASAADADALNEATTKLNTGEVAARANTPARIVSQGGQGLLSKGADEAGWREFQLVKTFDNGGNQAGRQVLLNRTPDTAPILGLLDQADSIGDLELQRQAKIDILGTARASTVARQRLIENVPEIARAQQRASLAPDGREALDSLHDALASVTHSDPASVAAAAQTWVDAATSFGTTENRAEIAALHTKALRNIHDSIERIDALADSAPLEQAGLTALDRAKAGIRNKVALDFHYQDGPSSATVRVLHWESNQRFRGTIATDNQIRGHQELQDWFQRAAVDDALRPGRRTRLWSASERQQIGQQFLMAKTQEERRRIVDRVNDDLYARVGALHDVDADQVKYVIDQAKAIRQGGVRYTTQELETARLAGNDMVTIHDPATGSPTLLRHALLDTHIANNVSLMDPMEVQRAYRKAKGISAPIDPIARRAAQFNNWADHFNNAWRLAVLGRPGLLVRTQIDGQGRAAAVMGGTAFVHSAMVGLGHLTAKGLKGGVFGDLLPDQLALVDATAADHALAHQLREEAEVHYTTAARNEKISKRRGTPVSDEPVVVPTLDDRGRILRGGDSEASIPLDADGIAQLSPAAMRAAADKKLELANHLETRQYETDYYRQGTKNETFNFGGHKQVGRFADSGQDSRDIMSAEYKSGRPSEAMFGTTPHAKAMKSGATRPPKNMAEVIQNAISREQARLYENRANHITHNPGDPHWSAGWIRTMDQFRNSYAAHKVLELADLSTHDLMKSLRTDKQVDKVWQEVRSDNEHKEEWLARLVNTVIWNAPTKEVREALLTRGHMSPDEVDKMFAPMVKNGATGELEKASAADTRPEQMHIQGPEFTLAPPQGTKIGNPVRKMVSWLSDVPDSVAARHPVTVDRWRYHVNGLANRAWAQHPEWAETGMPARDWARIQKIAKHRAIMDTQQVFYDTAKHTGAHNSLRYISPFMGAWQDAMESWSRLMYDDPAVAGGFNKIWNLPNRMGIVVDQNGDAIQPGQQADQSFLVVPAEWNNDYKTSKKINVRKDSLNSIFQGAQWYTPGVGPIVQIPVSELAAKIWPEIGDSKNPLVQSILPFGTPKTATGGNPILNFASDVAGSVTPAWAKALYSMKNVNDPNNALAYHSSINEQIIAARKAGKPIPSAAVLDKNAVAAARSAGFVRFISLFGLGVSGQEQGVADFYKKQYDLLNSQAAELHARGTTPSAEFVKNFPEAAGLSWSLTKSQTGVNANLQAWKDETKTYAKEVKANPDFGWFYAGADNLLPNNFSQSIYNAQTSRTVGVGGSTVERQRLNHQQLIDSSMAEDGWQKYNVVADAVKNILDQQGLTINQNAAAQIKAARDAAVQALRVSNPAWAKDFDTGQDPGKLQRFIDTIAKPALADSALKNRSDIQALGQYLSMRTAALQFISDNGGYKSLSATSGIVPQVAAALDAAGQELAASNLGFQQMWTRMFSSEVAPDKAPAVQAAS